MIHFIKKLLTAYAVFIIGSLLLLTASYSIPSSILGNSIGRSIDTLESEGVYPSFGFKHRKIVVDNFTDALMLNIAYAVRDNSLKSALLNERLIVSTAETNQTANLSAAYEGESLLRSSYERYWHGYLVILRPLLVLFSYQNIRLLLTLTLLILFGVLLYLTKVKVGLAHSIALFGAALATDFLFIGQSIQFSQVFLIGIIASIWYLLRRPTEKNISLVFFIVGMTTSFFDLLTAPLVTLAFLIVVTKTTHIANLIKNCFFWSIGYIVFWFSKWVIVETLFLHGEMGNALYHVKNRTINQPDANFNQFRAILLNIQHLIGYDKIGKILILSLAVLSVMFLMVYRKKVFEKKDVRKIFYWTVVAFIPYAWYLIAANHSYLHVWYTYRSQFMSIAAGVIIYEALIDWESVKRSFFKKQRKAIVTDAKKSLKPIFLPKPTVRG